jgi:carbon-monoxide dehydrogenase medium subunit
MKEAEVRNFEFLRPRDLSELLQIKRDLREKALILDGGTNLLIYIKDGVIREGTIVDVTALPELKGIQRLNGNIEIGAAETMTDLMNSDKLRNEIPFIPEFLKDFGNVLVRNTSTIGGNIADASPIADSAPPLMVLGAEVIAVTIAGERAIPLDEFFIRPQHTTLKTDEVLVRFRIPVPQRGSCKFIKLGLRRGTSCSIASVAVWLVLEENRVKDIRIALGGVAPKPIRAKVTESDFIQKEPNDRNVASIAQGVSKEISPITDVRGSADYRREVSAKLLTKAVRICAGLEDS